MVLFAHMTGAEIVVAVATFVAGLASGVLLSQLRQVVGSLRRRDR